MRNPGDKLAIAASPLEASQLHEVRQPLAVSAGLHLLIILLIIFGLPFFQKKPVEELTPISVSIINPSDMARTSNLGDLTKQEKPAPVQEAKAPEPPKPPPPPPPPPPAPVPPPEVVPEVKPVPELQTSVQEFAALPPLAKPMQIIKPKPVTPTPVPPQPNQVKTKQQEDQEFQSLLKNLSPPVPKADTVSKQKPVNAQPQAAQRAQVSNEMTADEMALIRERLKVCWIIPAGGYDAENMIIDVIAKYNPDMTLKAATLIDTNDRYTSDPAYRAAADSVMRALRNPTCNPLPLPPGKTDEITMKFDPKEMLGP